MKIPPQKKQQMKDSCLCRKIMLKTNRKEKTGRKGLLQ